MDEIFSLHEHRHLITFNGHRILLVFLVNLWNPEYTKIIRHFYYIIYSSPGQEHFLRLRLDKNTLIIRNRQTLRALYVGVLFQIYIPSGLTSVSGQIELPHKFITCSLEAATRTSTTHRNLTTQPIITHIQELQIQCGHRHRNAPGDLVVVKIQRRQALGELHLGQIELEQVPRQIHDLCGLVGAKNHGCVAFELVARQVYDAEVHLGERGWDFPS
jgi:hypothetical protein